MAADRAAASSGVAFGSPYAWVTAVKAAASSSARASAFSRSRSAVAVTVAISSAWSANFAESL